LKGQNTLSNSIDERHERLQAKAAEARAPKKKAGPKCQVCVHPERWRIELLRASGVTLDALAEKFGLDRQAIHRHWHGHVTDQMKATYLAGPVQMEELAQKAAEQGVTVLDHLNSLRVVLSGQMSAAVEAGDGRTVAYIAGQMRGVLETTARISGELGALATNQTFNIVNNTAVLAESPAFMRVQATLLSALADFPEARARVVAALRDLDEATVPTTKALPSPTEEVIDADFSEE
jgi:hypothetical protein